MKIYVGFCACIECNTPNIYCSEKFFEQKLKRKIKHTFCVQQTFSVTVKILSYSN
jgi:hypothetical protein